MALRTHVRKNAPLLLAQSL